MVDNIRKICKEKGTRISVLETKAGLPRGSIYKWDTNVPSIWKVATVANVLEVTVDEIINEERKEN